MKIIDISRTIDNGSAVWPGSAKVNHTLAAAIGPESPYQETRLGGWTTHLLTHIDAPAHMIEKAQTLDQIPLERFMGQVVVMEIPDDVIMPQDIPAREILQSKALFFKTRNSTIPTKAPFDPNYVYLSPKAAELCVERGATLIGIDYYSPDPADSKDYPCHNTLLKAGVLILECLQLKDVTPGSYRYAALPLKIGKADGSPVRAILFS